MTSNGDLVASALAQIPEVGGKLATFVGRVGVKAQVNIGSTSPILPYVGTYFPSPNDPVQLEMRNGELVVAGPARPKPGEGIITGTALLNRAKVTAWGVEYELRYNPAYTPVLADNVTIKWTADGEGVIDGKVSTTSNASAPGTTPGGGTQPYHPPPFTAIGSGTYRSSWFTNDVYASATNEGAWFYGSKIRDTIPDTASITSAYIYLPVRNIIVNAPGSMRLHTSDSQPGGAPGFFGSAVSVPAQSGWFVIPNGWIDYLKSNAGGIGFDGGGYWILRGTGSDGLSGALDIFYTA